MEDRQTAGIADLLLDVPPPPPARVDPDARWRCAWVEVKGAHGTLSLERRAFYDLNARAGVHSLVGGADEVLAWLAEGGWIR